MTRHATVEELSSLLDRELGPGPAERVRSHLTGCAGCQGRLEGLRSVILELERVERVAPPPTLGRELSERLRWEPERSGLIDRLERRLRAIPLQPTVAPVFAIVVALAAIMFFFVSGLERQKLGTPVILDPPGSIEAPQSPEAHVVAGRTFELQGGVWVESGVGDRVPTRRLHPEAAAGSWPPGLPAVSELARLGGPVRLLAGGEVVEIGFEDQEPAQ
jgi:hypothetical protein